MAQTYFKRYRMEISLRRRPPTSAVPAGYQLMPWNEQLIEAHATAKFRSFSEEIDATLFRCLGDADGCLRLMCEIAQRDGFLPSATWLAVRTTKDAIEPCGTIQGVRDLEGFGGIQNLGVTPAHRGRGLGASLLSHALVGFRQAGVRTVHLEVTAKNEGAIRLYRQLGFRHTRTLYKSVEMQGCLY